MSTPTLSPEQKSQSLITEYKNILPRMDYAVLDATAKQCSIIAVKMIIETDPTAPCRYERRDNLSDMIGKATSYWESVLKHLENI